MASLFLCLLFPPTDRPTDRSTDRTSHSNDSYKWTLSNRKLNRTFGIRDCQCHACHRPPFELLPSCLRGCARVCSSQDVAFSLVHLGGIGLRCSAASGSLRPSLLRCILASLLRCICSAAPLHGALRGSGLPPHEGCLGITYYVLCITAASSQQPTASQQPASSHNSLSLRYVRQTSLRQRSLRHKSLRLK